MNTSVLTDYYYICADILKDYLPCIPKLKLTNAKGYYGQIQYDGNNEFTIRLSKWNLDCGKRKYWDDEDIDELIDTICHEFAHILYWKHGTKHTDTTNQMRNFVNSTLKILECEAKLRIIDGFQKESKVAI